jgi:hypothetical protein
MTMKALAVIGVIVLIVGVLSFVVPFPSYHHHGVKVGDSSIGVTTEHDEKLSPGVGIALIVVGGVLVLAGRK